MRNPKRAVASLILSLALVAAPGLAPRARARQAAAAEAGDLQARLLAAEKVIDARREELGIPGVSLVVVKDDRVIYMKGLGVKDFEKRSPVTPDTLFAIGSASKAFTAMLVAMAADAGRLSLEDPPKKFLPYFKLRDPEADANITVRDLLAHRSGLNRTDIAWITGALTREEVIRVAAQARPTARLGEKFQYQNVMYSAAGEVAAKAFGSTWERLVRERIFGPLGMKASVLSVPEMRRARDYAFGYDYDAATGETRRLPARDFPAVAAAGAVNSNARDMSRWLRLMLGGGAFGGRRLVSERGFAELVKPQQKVAGGVSYGLGWFLRGWRGHRVVEHGGNIDGFNALVALVPDQRLGFVMLSNVTGSTLGATAMEALWSNLLGDAKGARPRAAPDGAGLDKSTGELAGPGPPKPVRPAAADSAAAAAPGLTVGELMRKAAEAAGGEANLRRHKTMTAVGDVSLEHQGVGGEAVIHARAPYALSSQLTLTALGKKIGTYHQFFDGTQGGEEGSFLSFRPKTGRALADARAGSAFYSPLDWEALFKTAELKRVAKVGDEEAYVVVLTPERGNPVTRYYSAKTFRLLRQDTLVTAGPVTEPITERYADYREVDGVLVAFTRVTTSPSMGDTVTRLREVRFDVEVPAEAFRRQAPPAKPLKINGG